MFLTSEMSTDRYVLNATPTIDQLNEERRQFQMPVVLTLGVIMASGVIGNVVVIYVYSTKKVTPASFLILLLALGDLTSCLFCIPFQMFDLSNPYKHPVPVACMIFRFLETAVNVMGGFVLMCITFDRYIKICHPFKRYTLRNIKCIAFVMFIVSLCLAFPQFFLAGDRTVQTRIEGLYGHDCSTKNGMFGSVFSLVYQAAISLVYGVGLIIFIVFYGRILHVVLKRKRPGESVSISATPVKGTSENDTSVSILKRASEMSTSVSQDNMAFSEDCTQSNNNPKDTDEVKMATVRSKEIVLQTDLKDLDRNNLKEEFIHIKNSRQSVSREDVVSQKSSRKGARDNIVSAKLSNQMSGNISNQMRIRPHRTTLIFAIVTVAGVVSFMPYLIVEVLRQTGAAFQPGMPDSEDLAYEFLCKTYFLNNIVNPVIYSVMNPMFRKDICAGIRKLFRSRR